MITNLIRASASLLLMATLGACAVGPEYERPTMDVPLKFKEATLTPDEARRWKEAQPADDLARGKWWAVFHDQTLDELQEQAMAANQDLKAAAARVRQARAMLKGARADRYPELAAGFGPTRQRVAGSSQDAREEDSVTSTVWRAQAGLSYEADLFGRIASGVDAATAEAERSSALYQSVLLALQADVAQTYFLVRQLDAEADLYENTVTLRKLNLDLIETRYREGDISELDFARARAQLDSARSESLGIARQRNAAEHALALLLGKAPSDFFLDIRPLESITVAVPAGLPSSLLERRPDIAAAERAMAAANARIGTAKAAFFPRLAITGAFGFESAELGELLQWSSRSFLLGPLVGTALSLPLFDGGQRQANLDRAKARYEEDVAEYRQTVLKAFKEVEDNLSALRLLAEQNEAQDSAVASAMRAADLSQTQYKEGLVSYLDVIDADRTVLQHKRVALQLDGLRAQAAVQLIRAIGGGWG